jgi:hypothetical protein
MSLDEEFRKDIDQLKIGVA